MVNDGSFPLDVPCIQNLAKPIHRTEKMLFCGWRRDMADMIHQLDEYVSPGSELWLLNVVPYSEREALFLDKGNKDLLRTENLTIKHVVGNPIVRRDLLKLQASDNNGLTGEVAYLHEFDSLLILADSVAIENGADMQGSDSRSLSSLLIIQEVQRKLHAEEKRRSIQQNCHCKEMCCPISEILDTRTRSLLNVANCTSYVMSNQIISSVIAQVAEDRDLNNVFGQLLCAEGSEIYLKEITNYLSFTNDDDEVDESFWNVALRAQKMGQVALGYKPADL